MLDKNWRDKLTDKMYASEMEYDDAHWRPSHNFSQYHKVLNMCFNMSCKQELPSKHMIYWWYYSMLTVEAWL